MRVVTPRVSVGLPVYNGDKYLQSALTSLLQQDFEDFEIIISDNASTDGTLDICTDFAQRDKRIRYFRNDANIGLAANHNRTFELSNGEFFKWVAHDDDFPTAMLSRFVEVLEEASPSVIVVYSQCEYIDQFGGPEWIDSDGVDRNDLRPHRRLSHLLTHVHMYNSAYGLIRSDMLRQTRLYGLYPWSDLVLLAELSMLGVFVEIPEPLLRIRRHPGRTFTATRDPKVLRELFKPGHGHRFSPIGIKTHMELELIRAAALTPIALRDRILCLAVATIRPQWMSFRAFAGRQKQRCLGLNSPGDGSSQLR
jgi:glycosyltransferase involved in cell wall biosynthesis